MARDILKKTKICLVCGGDFRGTKSKITCTPACRIELARIKEAKKRPEFLLVAKGKGQKIPDLTAPKRLKFKRGEKMVKPEITPDEKNDCAVPDEKAFDGEKLNGYILDEVGKCEVAKPLTKDQILTKISDLEKRKKTVEGRTHGFGDGHPKLFAMNKQSEIADLNKEIAELQKQLNPPI